MPRPLRIAALQPRTFEAAEHARGWEALLARVDQAIGGHALLVLPEAAVPGWALLSREAAAALSLPSESAWTGPLAERARRAGCAIAAGIVSTDADGALRNELVLFGPDGREVARAGERDAFGWFTPGRGPVVAEIEGVRIGLVVGRDLARRGLIRDLAGAQLLIAAAAPRGAGRGLANDASVESDLLESRAALLGAWAIVGGKAGSEGGIVRYAGSAGVIDPAGQWSVRAPAGESGVVSTEIDLEAPPGPAIDVAGLPPDSVARSPGEPFRGEVAAVAFDARPSAVESMERVRALVHGAVTAGARLVVLPDLAGTDPRAVTATETLPFLEALSADCGATIFAGLAERAEGLTYKSAYAIEDGRVIAAHRQSVLDRDERAAGFHAGEDAPSTVRTRYGLVGLLCGAEGLVLPAPSGAGITAWCAGDAAAPVAGAARAIAIEDGVAVAAAGSASRAGGAFVVDAAGRILAATPPGEASVATARLL
ncbi:MAG: hypothetical protein EPO16_05205 [Dehalococcoidia bacterium]|nr:MAG: hypothetical protein EPO16_05205 [Dehalococcoidia bacterium]